MRLVFWRIKNHFPGIDMVKFGENISVIHKRATFDHIPFLEVYEKNCRGVQRIIMNMKKYKALTGKKIEKNTGGCLSRSNRKMR